MARRDDRAAVVPDALGHDAGVRLAAGAAFVVARRVDVGDAEHLAAEEHGIGSPSGADGFDLVKRFG